MRVVVGGFARFVHVVMFRSFRVKLRFIFEVFKRNTRC